MDIKKQLEEAIKKANYEGIKFGGQISSKETENAADKCFSITKDAMKAFDVWKVRKGWIFYYPSCYYFHAGGFERKTFDELFDLFSNDQKEK